MADRERPSHNTHSDSSHLDGSLEVAETDEDAFVVLPPDAVALLTSLVLEPSDTELHALEKNKRGREPEEDATIMGFYLQDEGHLPLLTKEEEIALGKRIEKGKKAAKKLTRFRGKSVRVVKELKHQVADGREARNTFVAANTRLAISGAKRYAGRNVALMDLIQESNIGLIRAAEKWDWRRGFRFSTYAMWWIRQALTHAIAEQSSPIRIPKDDYAKVGQMLRKTREFHEEFGRDPYPDEIEEILGVSTEVLVRLIRHTEIPLSLDAPIPGSESRTLGDVISGQDEPPEHETNSNLLREKLLEAMQHLPDREAEVLCLRFGLKDGIGRSLEEVGDVFGVTRERIRQIEGRALRKLRWKEKKRLFDYLPDHES